MCAAGGRGGEGRRDTQAFRQSRLATGDTWDGQAAPAGPGLLPTRGNERTRLPGLAGGLQTRTVLLRTAGAAEGRVCPGRCPVPTVAPARVARLTVQATQPPSHPPPCPPRAPRPTLTQAAAQPHLPCPGPRPSAGSPWEQLGGLREVESSCCFCQGGR